MNRQIFTIEQVNNYVKSLMDNDPLLQDLWIRGEISNFKRHSSGHMYFTLKDNQARIKCVFFKYYGESLNFIPSDGMSVLVRGNISLYSKDGQYQLYVRYMEKDGIGELYAAFETLKNKLREEGLFRQEYKKPLPAYPKRIAIITSHTGAAVHDVIKVISKRNPTVDILIIPVMVQGEYAKDQISAAINYANTREDIDILIVGRGGGSIEELWAFNEEKVARAIFSSRIPVISAVGHETDFTIADLVADVRAATPSAAGEIAVTEISNIYETLNILNRRLQDSITHKLKDLDNYLNNLSNSYVLKYPERWFAAYDQRLDYAMEKIRANMTNVMSTKSDRFVRAVSYLEILNPLSIMMRGFSIVTDIEKGDIIRSIDQLHENMKVKIHLTDGNATCNITSKEKEPANEY
ncbi:MAG: exodeoxyribonuclease VII large subunit [Caldicoprobacterales bacterium]|nr:exodeoxyribonuclease VII large subunit [Clostridiales bacterium]